MNKNKIILASIFLVFAGFALAKFIVVSGPETTQNFQIKDITTLDVRSQIDVYLSQEQKEGLIIETYEDLMPYVRVEQDGQGLRIFLDRKIHKINWNGREAKINAYIMVKDLNKISLSGACDLHMETAFETEDLKISANGASDIKLDKINGNNIKIIMSGASDIEYGEFVANEVYINASGACDGKLHVNAKNLDVIASGASDFDINVKVKNIKIKALGSSDFILQGSAESFKANVSGSSDIRAYDLISDTVIVEASASSSCRVNAIRSIQAEASGASTIFYKGNPGNVRVDISGVSTIKKR